MKFQQTFNILQMLQNLNFAKFQKIQLDNLVAFENTAKRVFTCKDRRRYSRKRAKFCQKFAKIWQLPYGSTTLTRLRKGPATVRGQVRARGEEVRQRAVLVA